MLIAFIWLALVLAALAYAIIVYNGLVNLKHAIGKAWSNIDVLLKQRHDELPKLVETCKQYMQFERSALEKIMAARTGSQQAREAGDVKAVGRSEERRVGKECVRTCRSRGSPYHEKKNHREIEGIARTEIN